MPTFNFLLTLMNNNYVERGEIRLKNISGKKVLVLFVLYLLFALLIFPMLPQSKAGILDIKYYYTARQAYEIISNYSLAERHRYAIIAMTIDILYPIVYSLFLTALSIFLIGRLAIRRRIIIRLAYISMGAAVFDLLENTTLTIMMLNYPVKLNSLANIAGYFTAAKWTLIIAAILMIFYLTLLLLIKKIKST